MQETLKLEIFEILVMGNREYGAEMKQNTGDPEHVLACRWHFTTTFVLGY